MKLNTSFFMLLVGCFLLTSCQSKEERLLTAEDYLPGLWFIDSIEFAGYTMGIPCRGTIILNDTVLHDIGEFEISNFSLDSLELIDLQKHKVPCTLFMDGEQMEISLNSFYTLNDLTRAFFYYNGPPGPQPVDTPLKEFYLFSHIFNDLYEVEIISNEELNLRNIFGNESHVISLSKR